MPLKFIIIDSAQDEFKDIKKYVQKDFGDLVWLEVNSEYKAAFKAIKNNPQTGSPIEQLKDIGISNVKYMLVRQTKIVYEFDSELILIHMLINTKRDFITHLMKRLLG